MALSSKSSLNDFVDQITLYERRLSTSIKHIKTTKKRLNDAELLFNLYPTDDGDIDDVAKWEGQIRCLLDTKVSLDLPSITDIHSISASSQSKSRNSHNNTYESTSKSHGSNDKKKWINSKTIKGLEAMRNFKRFGPCTFAFGPKLEGQVLRTIDDYNGLNSIYTKSRTLVRKDARLSSSMSSLPPWIGCGYYDLNTSTEYLDQRPDSAYQVTFKAISRDVPTCNDIEAYKAREMRKDEEYRKKKVGDSANNNSSDNVDVDVSFLPNVAVSTTVSHSVSSSKRFNVKDYTYNAFTSDTFRDDIQLPHLPDTIIDCRNDVVTAAFDDDDCSTKTGSGTVTSSRRRRRKEKAMSYLRIESIEAAALDIDHFNSQVNTTAASDDVNTTNATNIKRTHASGVSNSRGTSKLNGIKSKYLDHIKEPQRIVEKYDKHGNVLSREIIKVQKKVPFQASDYNNMELIHSFSSKAIPLDGSINSLVDRYTDRNILFSPIKRSNKTNIGEFVQSMQIGDLLIPLHNYSGNEGDNSKSNNESSSNTHDIHATADAVVATTKPKGVYIVSELEMKEYIDSIGDINKVELPDTVKEFMAELTERLDKIDCSNVNYDTTTSTSTFSDNSSYRRTMSKKNIDRSEDSIDEDIDDLSINLK